MAVNARFTADFSSFLDAVKKAESSLNLWEANVRKVEGSMKRLDNGFSGRSIIQEATQVASAIDKIGGVSRLTESEQKRVNATITEAIAKYKALGQEAPAHLQQLAKATAQVEQQTSFASKAAGVLSSSFGQFTAANLAASAITKVTSELGAFISKGSQMKGLETSFESLSRAAKQNSGVMLEALQEGTRGLVSNFDLMQQANKAMLLGLPVTTESMGELAKTATTLGKAMGQDATTSLNDLITALGRSSPLILDNLGLTVKVGEANEAYAKKLGISVDAMDESQKKMAFYEAAMEAARKKTIELGDQTLTLSDRIKTVWVDIENNVTRSAGNMNLVLGKATESWRDFFQFIADAARFKSWEELAEKLRTPPEVKLPQIDPGALARVSKAYLDELKAGEKAFEEQQRQAEAARKKAAKEREDLMRSAAEMVSRTSEWERVNAEEQIVFAQAQAEAAKFIRENRQELILLPPALKDYATANEATTKTLHAMIDAGMRLPAVTEAQRKKFLEMKEATTDWKDELDKLARSMTDLAQVAGNSLVNALATLTNGINVGTKAWDSFKKGLDTLTSGGGLKSVLSGLTGIVGGIGGIVSAAQAAISAGKALFSVFDRDKGRDLVEAFAAEFSGGFDEINKYMGMLGEEGARMWKTLTQGKEVHSSPDAARKIIDEVRRAIEALRAAANSVPTDITVNVHTKTSGIDAIDRGGEVESFAQGSGGYRNFGRGTLAMLHGVEKVVPQGKDDGGDAASVVTQVYLDGRMIAEALAPHLPRVLQYQRV